MADNSSPRSYGNLIEQLEEAADGAHAYEQIIGLAHNTEVNIRMDLDALIGKPAGPGGVPAAVPGLKSLWNTARASRVTANHNFAEACLAARIYTRVCIHSLAPVLGESWNNRWVTAGFNLGSLSILTNPLVFLQQLRAYYADNPTHETPDLQGVACTATACEASAQTLTDAETACNTAESAASTAYTNFKNGISAGRARLSGLREELTQLIDDDDDRWYSFGFDKPSDPTSPDVPGTLTVTAGTPGTAVLSPAWLPGARATSYRVTAVLKSDGTEVADIIVKECQFTFALNTVAAGTLVDVSITSRNAGGESAPCNVVEIAVP